MRTHLAWITFGVISSLALLYPLSGSSAMENGKPDHGAPDDVVQSADGGEVVLWIIRGSTVSAEAPGTETPGQLAKRQPWGKPVLRAQAPSHTALPSSGLSSIGTPGTNDFFLPNQANQPVFPASSRVMGQTVSFSARANLVTPSRCAPMAQPMASPAIAFQEIPQTPAPNMVPRVIPSREIRPSTRRAPIILRAIPQAGKVRPASSTARIKLTLPRYQKRSNGTAR